MLVLVKPRWRRRFLLEKGWPSPNSVEFPPDVLHLRFSGRKAVRLRVDGGALYRALPEEAPINNSSCSEKNKRIADVHLEMG